MPISNLWQVGNSSTVPSRRGFRPALLILYRRPAPVRSFRMQELACDEVSCRLDGWSQRRSKLFARTIRDFRGSESAQLSRFPVGPDGRCTTVSLLRWRALRDLLGLSFWATLSDEQLVIDAKHATGHGCAMSAVDFTSASAKSRGTGALTEPGDNQRISQVRAVSVYQLTVA